MKLSLREYKSPDDYPKVRRLWEGMEKGIRLGRSDTLDEIQKQTTYNPELFLLAESGDELLGTVIAGYDGRRGIIYHLAVQKVHRKQGIGSLLMNEIENRLKARGCLKCYLLVMKDNPDAMHYYEKRDWEPMETVRLYGKELQ